MEKEELEGRDGHSLKKPLEVSKPLREEKASHREIKESESKGRNNC